MPSPLEVLQQKIVNCRLCPRLVEYREEVARTKRRAYRDCDYWGKPIPGFGDPDAEIVLVGLAPAAHGGNRTGRMFTGDRSGDFLYQALYDEGLANQPTSVRIGDGLQLHNVYITAAVRCAPPANRPTPTEILTCRRYIAREFELLKQVKVVIALGKIAFDDYLQILKEDGRIRSRSTYRFGHNTMHEIKGAPALIASYHPSQQNTQTGKLTQPMFRAVFKAAKKLAR